MTGGAVLAFVDAEHMAVKDGGLLVPMIGHIIGMDGKTWALQAAIRAKEPGDIASQLGIDSPAGEAELAFGELRIAFGPQLQSLRADFSCIGQNGTVAKLDLDVAAQRVAGGVFVVAAVVRRDDGFILPFDDLICDAQCDGLWCSLPRQCHRP